MTYSGAMTRKKSLVDEIVLEKMDTREWTTDELARRCGMSPDAMRTALKSLSARRLVKAHPIHCGRSSFTGWKAI